MLKYAYASLLNKIRLLSNLFQFEILFCVQDELDPAVKIVRQLMEAFPLVNSRLFTGKLNRTKIIRII